MLLDDFLRFQAKTTPQPLGMVVKRAKGSFIIDDKEKVLGFCCWSICL